MLYDAVTDPGSATAGSVHEAYLAELRSVLESVGIDAAASASDVDAERLSSLADGDAPTLTLTEAASVVALADGAPDAEAVVLEVRDHLLLGMTTAVLDVDTLASELSVDLSGQEVQQAIEGRVDPPLADLAAIQAVIDSRQP